MQCPGCGADVSPHQKFCAECGTALATRTAIDPDLDTQPIDATDRPGGGDAPRTTTIDADLVTEPIAATDLPTPPAPGEADPGVDLPPPSGDTDPLADISTTATWVDSTPTTPLIVPMDDNYVETASTVTTEYPAVFDGHDDLREYVVAREPFRFRLSLLLALFGALAMVMAAVADVIDIRTTRPTSGIAIGVSTLDDLGSNLALAGFTGTAMMVIGALLACFGLRWGAGLAAGGGLAVVGWAGLVIGLAELPIAVAESITRTSSESFTLRVTRDVGWWLVMVVGVLGLLVFIACLRLAGRGGRATLNPIVAALTALAAVVLAAGPLVPVGDASFTDNFRSTDPERDLPTAFFAGRLGQVALIALVGVVGMLVVRSFGLGLAAGGVSVAAWLWVSSLAELGSDPVGIALRNPGATSTEPHAVTTVGMVSTLVLLAIAAALAVWRLNRTHRDT